MAGTKRTFLLLFALLGIAFCAGAQMIKNYEKEWKQVDELMTKKNLPATALKQVQQIYLMAKRDKQQAQIIKALVYRINVQQESREDNLVHAIRETEQETAGAAEPEASILKSLLAGLYWQYFQGHRYELYGRTATAGFNKQDIGTWSASDFHKKIGSLYQASLQKSAVLKQTSLEPYNAIIIKGNVRYLRPTLYDLLAHEALNYFKNDERDLNKPAYAFEIDQAEAFLPASSFIKLKFVNSDSTSLQYRALLVFQGLLSFHLNDQKPAALIDADIERLAFVHEKATIENKDSLYLQALEALIQKYPSQPQRIQAQYLLAVYHNNLASSYDPFKDTTHRYERAVAKKILSKVVADSAVKTDGWTDCYNLLQEIEQKTCSFEVEKVNLPEDPFRVLIRFRNISRVYFRVMRLGAVPDTSQETEVNSILSQGLPTLRSWSQELPATNDYQTHAAEVKMEALPAGKYLLWASVDPAFAKSSVGSFRTFYVSRISLIEKEDDCFLLDRATGQPLAGGNVQSYLQVYNSRSGRNNFVRGDRYTADKNGYFKSKAQSGNAQSFLIMYANDTLCMDNIYLFRSAIAGEDTTQATFFFTDRSIYRPGQAVFFKAIALIKTGAKNAVMADHMVKIFLQDANAQIVDSLVLTTNEYGSVSGKFQLPAHTLNGTFRIYNDDDDIGNGASFSVEEYKRPSFSVNINEPKEKLEINDTVSVAGSAKSYSGAITAGAAVTFRVVRNVRRPYYYGYNWRPFAAPAEIAHGKTVTDQQGYFHIVFPALPDKKINKKEHPIFIYTVYADVTDISGETRTASKSVKVGYESLTLVLTVPETLVVAADDTINVRTENLNGVRVPSTVTVEVSKLHAGNRLIRPRFWQQPDMHLFAKDQYLAFFPHDEYSNESDFHNWPVESKVFERTDSTRKDGVFPLPHANLAEGVYLLTATTIDKNGIKISDSRFFEVFDATQKQLMQPKYLWITEPPATALPGETVTIQAGSSARIFLIKEITRRGGRDDAFSFDVLDSNKKTLNTNVTEQDRGGYHISFMTVKDNAFFTRDVSVAVPWTNKELTISYETFRDHLLPGTVENWNLKISGYKNNAAASEVLASMYDASLDQFRAHYWQKPDLWPALFSVGQWNGFIGFGALSSFELAHGVPHSYDVNKRYDQLLRPAAVFRYRTGKFSQNLVFERKEGIQDAVVVGYGTTRKGELAGSVAGVTTDATTAGQGPPLTLPEEAVIRKNLNETAFFFPDLRTDSAGNVTFSFMAPEALTQWKLQTLAHTKELAFGYDVKTLVTQKKLMVQPNMPRFLRQGDHLELTTRITNLSDSELTGQVQLELIDPETNQSVDGWFINSFPNQYFTVAAGQTENLHFPVQVPFQYNKPLLWRFTAKTSGAATVPAYSDGEQNVIPVLSNKALVTQTLPLFVNSEGSKNFQFGTLLQSGDKEGIQHHLLTVEYSSNPAWYAVEALPYLSEFPYECAEQTWNRYYANALAEMIANASPKLKRLFDQWKNADTTALLSNLQKNDELKSALLQETPWVLQAQSEAQQRRNIALLFDHYRMQGELAANLAKLSQKQTESGGFVWFDGGPADRYITQYIVTGIGHLEHLGALTPGQSDKLKPVLSKAFTWLDEQVLNEYEKLVQSKASLAEDHISSLAIQYLYMRSFFPSVGTPANTKLAYDYFSKQAKQYWQHQSRQLQGMIAINCYRTGDQQTAQAILRSLKERAISNEELGMYWKEDNDHFKIHWAYAPIETQSLLIEAFAEISKDTKTVDALRLWLLRNKQTNNWSSTKATADACYALLLQGNSWLQEQPAVQIKLGNMVITDNDKGSNAPGYLKQVVPAAQIKPEMGNIVVTSRGNASAAQPSFGAVYWQYFQDVDQIAPGATTLQVTKKLFLQRNTDKGPVLDPIQEGTVLQTGQKITVRIELRTDRELEYVHMKDMRAAALEPADVLSGYRWQGGLGYYQTTNDASTDFFFDHISRGTYVFEYNLYVTHTGTFNNGITTVQCMYAPEFAAHSGSEKIVVE